MNIIIVISLVIVLRHTFLEMRWLAGFKSALMKNRSVGGGVGVLEDDLVRKW